MLVFAASGLLALTGCPGKAPDSPPPSPTASVASASPASASPVATPTSAGLDQIRRRGVALQALLDPADPLKLDAGEKETVAKQLRLLDLDRDRYEFREAEIYGALKGVWRPGEDVAPPPGATPEGTFAVNAKAARAKLEARAGTAKAEAAPYPAALQQPRTTLGADDPDGPWESVVPSEQRQMLPALPQLLDEVAPQLTPEQAARALAELALVEDLAREQELAWKELLLVVEAGKRGDALRKAGETAGEMDLIPLLDRSIAWSYGPR